MRNSGTYLMFQRLSIIRSLIQNECYPTLEQLRQGVKSNLGVEVSISTLLRDIEFLRSRADCPVSYSRQKRGYFIAS